MATRIPLAVIAYVIRNLPTLVGLLAAYMEFTDYFIRPCPLFSGRAEDSYDFIVVGGGSAGSAVSSRLSEVQHISVLLLEAGGTPNPVTLIPAAAPHQMHSSITYQYRTVPQKGCALGMQNQSVLWPRGKALGGTSNMNFMTYSRGNANDYEQWARITGDPRWSYKNVLRYFLKLEDYHGHWDGKGNEGLHSKGGPLRVEGNRYTKGVRYILRAAEEFGLPIRDPNAYLTSGFAPNDVTQKRGMRFSTYQAYIKPNEHRKNFRVLRYSQVTQVHFDETLRAIGVTYYRHGAKYFVRAKKEIVISTGSIVSPQLLMLSGIGPKEHLAELGIPVLLDLPGVGMNLQDHVTTFVGPFLLNGPESFIPERDLTLAAIGDYLKDGSGPLSVPMGVTTFGFSNSRFSTPAWPDILWSIHSLGIHQGLSYTLDGGLNTRNQLFRSFLAPHLGQDAHFMMQVVAQPKSVGYVRLRDTNPSTFPEINPRYYSDPQGVDFATMLEGVQQLVKLYENSTSLGKELGARLSPNKVPGCEMFEHRSNPYWECLIRTVTGTLYHPAGTCFMGRPDLPGTVVDSQLRVLGTRGLRVADCSIMPKLTSANTNAPAIMIGEMCADMVKKAWSLPL